MAGKQLSKAQRLERFWSFVSKSPDPDGCWTWTGYRMPRGYGNFQSRDPHIGRLAHRYAYAALVGPIPEAMAVLHRCDRPSCVRPEHLFLGTQLDNMGDAVAKGRQVQGAALLQARRAGPTKKLTVEQIREIRNLVGDGRGARCLLLDVAARFGITEQQTRLIGRRRAWAWVE